MSSPEPSEPSNLKPILKDSSEEGLHTPPRPKRLRFSLLDSEGNVQIVPPSTITEEELLDSPDPTPDNIRRLRATSLQARLRRHQRIHSNWFPLAPVSSALPSRKSYVTTPEPPLQSSRIRPGMHQSPRSKRLSEWMQGINSANPSKEDATARSSSGSLIPPRRPSMLPGQSPERREPVKHSVSSPEKQTGGFGFCSAPEFGWV